MFVVILSDRVSSTMSFFSEVKHSFLTVPESQRIETVAFLDACAEVVPFFDILGATTFAPVKIDINGNIKKLRTLYSTDPVKYKTLQDIVESEIQTKTTQARNSGTDALLWLKRAMQFIIVFLKEVLIGTPDLVQCARKAYEKTLKLYHGWLVRGIFSLAVKSVPYRKDFMSTLGKGNVDELTLMEEMQNFVDLLDSNLDVIQAFYTENGVDDSRSV